MEVDPFVRLHGRLKECIVQRAKRVAEFLESKVDVHLLKS